MLEDDIELERELWADWVKTVCGWRGIACPTNAEWDELRKLWHADKAPVDSVSELQSMRLTPNA